ncbi:MAG: glycosyltransferase [Marinilabiliaceae bacterium]|jgi:hypothetical protein|nr:glycosyltransferase [Marinilabiliaceae bacterium]
MAEQDKLKKVLIVSNHYPGLKSGGSFVSLAYINAFARLYKNCSLIYPERLSGSSDDIDKGVLKIPVRDKRHPVIKGLRAYTGKIHRFRKTLIDYLSANHTDILVFDTSIVAAGTIRAVAGRNIYIITIHHNVERDYLAANPPNILYRVPYLFYARKAEEEAIRYSNLNLVLTSEDETRFGELFPGSGTGHIKETGVFKHLPPAKIRAADKNKIPDPASPCFVITGNLAFRQSDISIRHFIAYYWPLLKSVLPGATLLVTGAKPGKKLTRACLKRPDIKLYPNPERIDDIVGNCDYYISPVFSGSGFKLRAMDGLSCGLPVLSHTVSARGYSELINSGCMFTYNSGSSFVDALDKMLKTAMPAEDIIKACHNGFSFETGVERLEAGIKDLIA